MSINGEVYALAKAGSGRPISQPQRKDAMGRYDSGYKLLFSYPYLVESLIRGFVPGPWIDQLDSRAFNR